MDPNKPKDLSEELKNAISNDLASYMQNSQSSNSIDNSAPLQNSPKMGDSVDVSKNLDNIISQKINQPTIRQPIVRTYKSDVEETIQTGHISSVNIALAERNKTRDKIVSVLSTEDENKSIKNRNIIIISLLLIICGALAIMIPYFLVQKQANPEPVKVETVPSGAFMSPDIEEKINLNDLNLSRFSTTIKERVEQSALTLGKIKNIYFTEGTDTNEKVIDSNKFLTLLKANLPPEIVRTLRPEFMFGVYSYDGLQRFLILRVGSYDTTFAGMLSWEVNLWNDFREAFNLKNDVSTSSIEMNIKRFEDATYDNKDARVVKNSTGKAVFLYSIIDNNTVVITTSPSTLHEIITRMGRAKINTR